MPRNRYLGYLPETHRGYLAAFDLQWNLLESRRITPEVGAAAAFEGFIASYRERGWIAEGAPTYGFVFMQRQGVRILLQATPRDPAGERPQGFNPYRSSGL